MTEMIAGLPAAGDYVSMVKVAVMLVLATPWLYACPWVNKDTKLVRAPQLLWNASVLLAGILGIFIWLLMPMYMVGLLVYLVLSSAALIAYVVWRNGRVPEAMRVLTAEHIQSLFSANKVKQIAVTNRVKLYGADGKVVVAPTDDADDNTQRQNFNLAQDFLYELLFARASEADLQGNGRLRYVIDGVVGDRPPMEPAQADSIIQYLKPIAGLVADERRRPQTGKISVDLANSPIDLVLTTAGTTTGQRMQFKVVQEFVQTNIELLGMSSEVLAKLKQMSKEPSGGLLIVSGSSGSGVTSTLYSLLREQDAFVKQLVTLESKVVVDLENVTQTSYGDQSQLPAQLASALKRDPDFLMLDECESTEAAQLIAEAVATKTVVLGMKARDSFTAMAKWIKLLGPEGGALDNLRGVLCQILVRKLCPTCREAYRPDPTFLKKANLPAQKIENFYRPPSGPLVDEKGKPYVCPTCHGNAYFGRTGVFELLEMTDELRQLVSERAGVTQIQNACRKNKMLYIQEQALRKVIEGLTSIQEVIRVTQQAKKA